MNKLYFMIVALLAANGILFAQNQQEISTDTVSTVTIQNIEVLSSDSEGCWSGGEGASACSISAGIHAGFGFSEGCSVSCYDGYYACCGIRCECKKN